MCALRKITTLTRQIHTRGSAQSGGGNVKIKVFPAKKQNKKKTPKPPRHPSTHAHKNKSSCAMTHSKSRKKKQPRFLCSILPICSAQWVTSGARACLCTCTWACTRMCCFGLSVCGLKPRCPCNVIALQLAVPQRCVA